jgi:hypothetical protein
VGDPAGSNATADLALRVTGTHKPLHRNKVEIPSEGKRHNNNNNNNNKNGQITAISGTVHILWKLLM